jgi:hypothetical protein
MEVSGQLHAPAALPPGEEPPVPIGQEAGWAQRRSGRGGEEINSHPLTGLELLTIKPVAQSYTTELSQFVPSSLNQSSSFRMRILLHW